MPYYFVWFFHQNSESLLGSKNIFNTWFKYKSKNTVQQKWRANPFSSHATCFLGSGQLPRRWTTGYLWWGSKHTDTGTKTALPGHLRQSTSYHSQKSNLDFGFLYCICNSVFVNSTNICIWKYWGTKTALPGHLSLEQVVSQWYRKTGAKPATR